MIDLGSFRSNIYHNYGIRECPHYGEDGVLLKIFSQIGISKKPLCVEFGESRVLGTTTRAFRIKYFAKAIYFTGDYDLRAFCLNILDVLKVSIKNLNLRFFKFFLNFPYKFYVSQENFLNHFNQKLKNHEEIDLFTIDIDSYDYYLVRDLLDDGIMPRVLIVEYNPSYGLEDKISFPVKGLSRVTNKRMYGASYKAMTELICPYGYKLCFVSGFCNLFFIKEEFSHLFEEPQIEKEITDTDEKILNYIKLHCQNGFLPSWFDEPRLSSEEVSRLDHL